MAISEAEVRKVAMLARLALSDEEVETLTRQLDAILEYVGKLDELDTASVEPMAHAVEISNVFRPDEVAPSLDAEDALANAPRRRDTFFLVPKVLDQS